ncbi:MAG: hypothetical protein FJW39_05885 [Acidobacteria bacterium]|nr:hypothetical protein [Acidobacteriota bacterium]
MTPPVFLNHFFLTLDRDTFAAVRDSAWLKTVFAPYEERTTQRNDAAYTGIYFYGRNTYFEFFEDGAEGRPVGASGIALGIERPADLSAVLPVRRTITRRTGAAEPPWFHSLSVAGDVARSERFRTWVMEYHADFLANWYPELPPVGANSLRRRNVLDRYVAKIGQDTRRSEFLFKDVTAIELALDGPQHAAFPEMLVKLGYQASGGGANVTATGPEIRIHVVPSDASGSGIRRVTFSLQRGVAGEIAQRFGARSKMIVSPRGEAVWTF